MKLNEILVIDQFISGLDLTKFDSKTRIAILKNHLQMKRLSDAFEGDVNSIKQGLINGHEERVQDLSEARAKGMSENDIKEHFPDVLSLEEDLNRLVSDLVSQEVPMEFHTVEIDSFLEGIVACGRSLTASDLSIFVPFFES